MAVNPDCNFCPRCKEQDRGEIPGKLIEIRGTEKTWICEKCYFSWRIDHIVERSYGTTPYPILYCQFAENRKDKGDETVYCKHPQHQKRVSVKEVCKFCPIRTDK